MSPSYFLGAPFWLKVCVRVCVSSRFFFFFFFFFVLYLFCRWMFLFGGGEVKEVAFWGFGGVMVITKRWHLFALSWYPVEETLVFRLASL